MKKFARRALPAMGALALATQATAQMFYEPFDYGSNSIGTKAFNLAGSSGAPSGFFDPNFAGYSNQMSGQTWYTTGTSSTNDPLITSGNGSIIAGTGDPSGNSLAVSPSSKQGRIGIASTGFTSTEFYYSVQLTVDGFAPGAAVKNYPIFYMNNLQGTQTAAPGVFYGDISVTPSADGSTFQLFVRTGGGIASPGTQSYPTGTSLTVVIDSKVPDVSNPTTTKFWVFPTASTDPVASGFGGAAPTLAPIATQAATLGAPEQIGSFGIGNASAGSATFNIDEIRLDTAWSQVTPLAGNTWSGSNSSTWGDSGNWSGTSAINSAGAFVNFNVGTPTNVSLASDKTVGTINFKSNSNYTISSSGGKLILDGGTVNGTAGRATINVYSINDVTTGLPSSSSHTISANVSMPNALEVNAASAQSLTISGNIDGSYLTKGGVGTLTLTSANTFTGPVEVIAGTLQVNGDSALGAAPASPTNNIILHANAPLQFTADTTLNANRNIQIYSYQNAGGFAWDFNGIIDTGGHNVTIPGKIDITSVSGTQQATRFIKQDDGTLTLTNGSNTQTSTYINGGTLAINSDGALGPAPAAAANNIFLNGGTLQYTTNLDISNNRNIVLDATNGGTIDGGTMGGFGGNISGGPLTKAGNGFFQFSGNGSFSQLILKGGTWSAYSETDIGTSPASPMANNVEFNGGALRIGTDFSGINGNRGITVDAGGGTFDTHGFNATFAQGVVGTGVLTKTGDGTLTVPILRTGGLNVTGGKVVIPVGGGTAGTSVLSSVSVSGGAFDLGDHSLIVNYSGASPAAQIHSMLAVGYNNGAWNGNGITSASAASDTTFHTALGYAEASQLGIANGGSFAGQAIAGQAVVVKYTYYGDNDLDGKVTLNDFSIFVDGFNGLGNGWVYGDYDYSGAIDSTDFSLFVDSYKNQGTSLSDLRSAILSDPDLSAAQRNAMLNVVPEPTSLSLLAIGAGAMGLRRRRKM